METDQCGKIMRLVEEYADPCAKDRELRTSLHIACADGDIELAKYLVSKGARVGDCDRWGNDSLKYAVLGCHIELIHVLRGTNSPISVETKLEFEYMLCRSAAEGGLDRIRALLAAGASSNAKDYDGRSALQLAAANGRADAVQLLLSHGADTNFRDRWGSKAEDYAAMAGHSGLSAILTKQEVLIPDNNRSHKRVRQEGSWSLSRLCQLPEASECLEAWDPCDVARQLLAAVTTSNDSGEEHLAADMARLESWSTAAAPFLVSQEGPSSVLSSTSCAGRTCSGESLLRLEFQSIPELSVEMPDNDELPSVSAAAAHILPALALACSASDAASAARARSKTGLQASPVNQKEGPSPQNHDNTSPSQCVGECWLAKATTQEQAVSIAAASEASDMFQREAGSAAVAWVAGLGNHGPGDLGAGLPLQRTRSLHITTRVAWEAAVVFIDIKGFTARCSTLTPAQVGAWVSDFYERVDRVAAVWALHKVEVRGDCCICVATADVKSVNGRGACGYMTRTLGFAADLHADLATVAKCGGLPGTAARIGVAAGPVAFLLDEDATTSSCGPSAQLAGGSPSGGFASVQGDAVNLAARMEALASPGVAVVHKSAVDRWTAEVNLDSAAGRSLRGTGPRTVCVACKGRGLQPAAAYDLARRDWLASDEAAGLLPAEGMRSLHGLRLPEGLLRNAI